MLFLWDARNRLCRNLLRPFYYETISKANFVTINYHALIDLTPESIADAFDIVFSIERTFTKIKMGGMKFTKEMPTLEEEMNRIYAFMLK